MHFRDELGRTIVLRGVNLADGKFSLGEPTYRLESLHHPESCSYINSFFTIADSSASRRVHGRGVPGADDADHPPAEATDAHRHLARLRYLGFNTLRIPVAWEALEHGGPGVYDDEYIEYIHDLVKLCTSPPYNFRVMINPHQDLWSRHAGGSGAPLWTIHACGLDERYFGETHASVKYAEWPLEAEPSQKRPQDIPPMMWTTNHNRLATMTVFALFFAGNAVAPKCRLRNARAEGQQDENIQDFLQRHYLAAYGRLMARLGNLAFAYDSMNEPEPGFVGLKDLSTLERENTAKIGSTPSPIESMRLGMGMEQEVDEYRLGKTGPHKKGKMTISPKHKCWLEREDARWEFIRAPQWRLGECVWAQHGVWDVQTGELLEKDYFQKALPLEEDGNGKERMSFESSFWQDYHRRWTATIRNHSTTAISLIQPTVFSPPPPRHDADDKNVAYAPHYYDGLTVMHRHWHDFWNADIVGMLRGHHKTKVTGLRVGKNNVRKAIGTQLGLFAKDAPEIPTIIGEMGIPFNLDDGKAYRKAIVAATGEPKSVDGETEGGGNYTDHVQALDAIMSGCDAHLLNYTLWAYSPINTHQWGDHWNGEDLSIYCAETGSFPKHEQLAGFRAAAAWCRPFVETVSGGELKGMEFSIASSEFEAEIEWTGAAGGGGVEQYALVYVPWLHYRASDEGDELALSIEISEGDTWEMVAPQQLRWRTTVVTNSSDTSISTRLKMKRAGGALSERELGTIL